MSTKSLLSKPILQDRFQSVQLRGTERLKESLHDHLVDRSHAEQNASWAGGPSKLVILPRGDHNSIFFENRERYLRELSDFVASLDGR